MHLRWSQSSYLLLFIIRVHTLTVNHGTVFNLLETDPVGFEVANFENSISGQSDDIGDVQMKIVSPGNYFSVGDTPLSMIINNELDYEVDDQFQFSIEFSDSSDSVTKEFRVNIQNMNDNDPFFYDEFVSELKSISRYDVAYKQGQYILDGVPEESTHLLQNGDVVGQLHVNDLDCQKPDKLDCGFEFSIDDNEYLTINSKGELVVKDISQFDYETKYNDLPVKIKARVADQGTEGDGSTRMSKPLTINLNIVDGPDRPPIFTRETYLFRVEENNRIGKLLDTVRAVDQDEDLPDGAWRVSYSVNTDVVTIGASSGELKAAIVFDAEATLDGQFVSYEFTVVATEIPSGQFSSLPPLSANAVVIIEVIDENDNSPELVIEDGSFNIPENRGSGAEIIGPEITVYDADVSFTNSKWSLEITNPDECPVQPQPSQGSGMSVVKLRALDNFDFEEMTSCEAILVVSDESRFQRIGQNAKSLDFNSGSSSILRTPVGKEAVIVLNVIDENDNSPRFMPLTPLKPVPENVPIESIITTVHVVDEDSFDSVYNFEIISGNRENTFRLSEAYKDPDGIWSCDVVVAKTLDYDSANARFELTIRVTDEKINGRTNDNSTTIIVELGDVDDNPPKFKFHEHSLKVEETQIGEIFSDEVTDEDGIFSDFMVKIDTEAEFDGIFNIVKNRMFVSIEVLQEQNGKSKLEGMSGRIIEITLTVHSVDNIYLNSSSLINVEVIDVNNNSPQIYNKNRLVENNDIIRESYRENTNRRAIIELECDDQDQGPNGEVGWRIETSGDYALFQLKFEPANNIHSRHRVGLYFTQPPDYEQQNFFSIELLAFDKPNYPEIPNETRVRIYVEIIDEDDNEPYFYGFMLNGENRLSPSIVLAEFEEEKTGSVTLGSNLLIDFDSVAFQNNKIFILSETDRFAISKKSNGDFTLVILQKLDYETEPEIIITIGCARISDAAFGLGDNYDARQINQIKLRVLNVDDNPPIVTGATNGIIKSSVYLTETPNSGNAIFTVVVDDPDNGENESNSDEFIFEIKSEVSRGRSLGARDSSEYFSINQYGEVMLTKQIASDIFQLDLDITVRSTESGPSANFILRFYPIKKEDVVRIQTKESYAMLITNMQELEAELSAVVGENMNSIVHQIDIETNENGEPNGQHIIVARVWDINESVVPPDVVISRLNSRESDEFLSKYKIAGIKTEIDPNEPYYTTYCIVIGVLAVLLLATIIVSVVSVRMMRNKFQRKKLAADIMNEVNAEEFSAIQPKTDPNMNPLKGVSLKYMENFPEDETNRSEADSLSIAESHNSFTEYDPVEECYVAPGPIIERFDF